MVGGSQSGWLMRRPEVDATISRRLEASPARLIPTA